MEQFVRNACLMHCPEPHRQKVCKTRRFSCTIEKWDCERFSQTS